ncbi:hypothetical protein D1007_29807 [Hordeum vulgare]|nr:hypothetical protein D1007_29807 [Hordeum vulgare]
MPSSAPNKGQHSGAWLGNDICVGHIEALFHHRMLPPASLVAVRLPGAQVAPIPKEGEVVVFEEHFYRGFGLPESNFFAHFLTFFGLQPHHMVPNAILQLASFVVPCEGFLGIEPRLDLWQKLFFFKQQSVKMDKAEAAKLKGPRPMTPCGAALVHHRTTSGFPQMPLQDSIKMWQRGFFYVKNVDPSHDCLNLPPFTITPPTAKKNWKASHPERIAEVALICAHLDNMKICGLLGHDLLTNMMTHWILPLQRRPHLVCQMGGQRDPCRLSTKNFRAGAVAQNMNMISSANMDEGGADDVEASDPSGIEDEGVIEPRAAVSEGSEEALESEGSEPPGEHLKPSPLDWTDDDETPPSLHDAAFGEDLEDLEEVTNPPLMRGRCNAGETAAPGEAARNKGKGVATSKPAHKRAATGPPVGGRGGGAKKHHAGAGRKRVLVVGGDVGEVEEETASAAERAA